MKNGHCSHSYPKQLTEVTVALENGKIIHRRQNTGRVVLKHSERNIVELDNKWVVPYNPYPSFLSMTVISKLTFVIQLVQFSICTNTYIKGMIGLFWKVGKTLTKLNNAWKEDTFPLVKHVGGFWDLKQMVLVITLSGYLFTYQINNMSHFMLLDLLKEHCRIMKNPCSLNFSKSIWTFNSQYKMVLPHKVSSSCEFPEHYAWNQRTKTWAR
jgi:hypothetical protein